METESYRVELFLQALTKARSAGVGLVLLSGDSDNKPDFIAQCRDAFQGEYVNLGIELSRHLLDCDAVVSLSMEASNFVRSVKDGADVFLDGIEILFDSGMEVHPISILKNAARHRIVCANWPGRFNADTNELCFGDENDPVFRSFAVDSETIVLDETGRSTCEEP